jgi:Zn-dependent peptidase ImmA (M78 family)
MIDHERIIELVASMKQKHPCRGPRELIEDLDIGLLEVPMGPQSGAIKGFIQKNSRCYTIAVNSDLAPEVQDKILFHEIGHYALHHLSGLRKSFLADQSFSYRRDAGELARKENEANFFAAEYLLDTEETLLAIHQYDLATAAHILRVPLEFLDYKLRLLYRLGRLEKRPNVMELCSNCLIKMETTGIITDC